MEYRRADKLVSDLCEEIDIWKAEAEMWKEKYDSLNREYSKYFDESLKASQKGVAEALKFALYSSDDKDGNLVISRENRKQFLGDRSNDMLNE